MLIPPHAPTLEKAVLSILLAEPERFDTASVETAMFFVPAHAEMFDLAAEQWRKNHAGPIDLAVLVQAAADTGALDRIGGPSAAYEVYTAAAHSGHFEQHLAVLREQFACRLAMQAAQELLAAAAMADLPAVLAAASERITAIHDAASANQSVLSKSAALEAFATRYEALALGEAQPLGMETSLWPINRHLKGLHTKRIYVVSGYPTAGKSILGAQLLADLARAGNPSLMLTLELPAERLIERLIVYLSRRPALAVCDPLEYARQTDHDQVTADQIRSVQNAVKLLAGMPLEIEDRTAPTLGQIEATIRRHHRQLGIKAVCIDYLQLIRADQRGRSKEEEVAEASHRFQALAKELDLCVLLLSQQNAEGATKYAQAVSEDADCVLSIVTNRAGDNPDNRHLFVYVRKDRHNSQTGTTLPLVLDREHLRFDVGTIVVEDDRPRFQPILHQ